MSKYKEIKFEREIVEALKESGWIEGDSKGYDVALGLYREDLLHYIKQTQPNAYAKMQRREGERTDDVLCKHIAKEMDKRGALNTLRKEVKYIGAKFKLCQFKPQLPNPDTQTKYDANILRVVPQLYYSEKNNNSIDLVLFLNGIPIATIELKSDFTQNVQDAINQYRYDREPKGEVLLEFNRRALVHFAVSNDEVYMTTKLAGAKSRFLPFNRGKEDGSAGNPPNPNGYATEYLYREILQRDSLLNILERFLHLKVEERENHQGKKERSETLIFPRYHQLDAVRKLLEDSRTKGAGEHYLIQHSAGSGKSNSIAWLAHQLSSLHNKDGKVVFDSVVVITDRTVLDNQLQETIGSFEHKEGVVVGISREGSSESKSQQLSDALERGAKIIVTTIQTFPFVLDTIRSRATLKERNYAVIADEAHSSQSGATAKKLKEVLGVTKIDENEEISAEDVMVATLEAEGSRKNMSFYAFTATPKQKTLELFGTRPNPSLPPSVTNIPEPFHSYTMKQAIEEGFILDVLRGYTTYKLFYKLEHANPKRDQEVESKKAKRKIAKWLNIHPYNIAQKVEVIVEHFRTHIAHLLDGKAKAMVVTSSRQSAVRYKLAFDRYVKEQGYSKIASMVAFSGKVIDNIEGEEREYTEANMNPTLRGRDMRKAFDSSEFQVMIVANKFQTGFDQPKLCAMYVDKKLGGVDCVQTLSRLNRIYPGKEQTSILDFVNESEDIKKAFAPYYKTTSLEDVTDPNILYDLESKLQASGIFTQHEVESYAKAFFDPKGTQAQMSAAVKPAADRYKGRYKELLKSIYALDEQIEVAKRQRDKTQEHNLSLEREEVAKQKRALEIFKKDLGTFVRMYEFLSQIVDYQDEELLALYVYAKGLLPNLRTVDASDPIDLSAVELTHYKLRKEHEESIRLEEETKPLSPLRPGEATAHEPETDLLSHIVQEMSALFEGELSEEDMLGYARTISDKVMQNSKVLHQVSNNSKEQAMMGGFSEAISTAVIDSLDLHQNLATQLLKEDLKLKRFANIIYDMVAKSALYGTDASSYEEPLMKVAEPPLEYGKNS